MKNITVFQSLLVTSQQPWKPHTRKHYVSLLLWNSECNTEAHRDLSWLLIQTLKHDRLPRLFLGSWNPTPPKLSSAPLYYEGSIPRDVYISSPENCSHEINITSCKWCMGWSKIQTRDKLGGITVKLYSVCKKKKMKWCDIYEHSQKQSYINSL